jgi:hypothetical protein
LESIDKKEPNDRITLLLGILGALLPVADRPVGAREENRGCSAQRAGESDAGCIMPWSIAWREVPGHSARYALSTVRLLSICYLKGRGGLVAMGCPEQQKGASRRVGYYVACTLVVGTSSILSLACGCAERAPATNQDGRSRFSREVTEYVIPSGFYRAGTVLRHEFRIVNDTDSVVRLALVSSSCSCATAEVSRKEVQPGEETSVKMTLRLASASGKRNARCVLGDDKDKRWVFEISATSYPLMEFAEGGSHAYPHLGTFDPGEGASAAVDVFTYAGPNEEPPRIELDRVPGNVLETQVRSGGVEALSDGFRRRREQVLIRLPNQTEPGLHKADIAVRCRSAEASERARITAIWQVRSLYSVEPDRIGLGVLRDAEGEKIRRTVTVKRIDGKPLRGSTAKSSHPAISIEGPTCGSSNAERVTIVVDTGAIAGPLCGEVSIDTHDPLQSPLTVPVVGFR